MEDRFDQEFYRSFWQRVLPVGPHGIQPYVRTGRSSGLTAAPPALHRPLAMLAGLVRDVIAFRCRAIPMAECPLPAAAARAGSGGDFPGRPAN